MEEEGPEDAAGDDVDADDYADGDGDDDAGDDDNVDGDADDVVFRRWICQDICIVMMVN